jgi:hypothetical protein
MTDEQKIERRKWLDENFKDNMICNNKKSKEDGTHYVFISYKSDDWEKALKDIVYPLVKDYGLNVYFDREFEDRNDNWVDQFTDNMNEPLCKGVVAFYSKKYTKSYATVMELMYSQTEEASCTYRDYSDKNLNGLPVVFINWDDGSKNVKDYDGKNDTGLGKAYGNGNSAIEKKRFEEYFDKLVEKGILKKSIWNNKDNESIPSNKPLLDVAHCKEIANSIKQYKQVNDKEYDGERTLKYIRNSIEDAFGPSVFSQVEEKKTVTGVDTNNTKTTIIKEENNIAQSGVEKIEGMSTKSIEAQNNNQGYTYTIFGKEYSTTVQADLMYDAFEALTNKNPEYARMSTAVKCVSKVEDVTDANTKNAKPSYFRACKSFNINGEEYLVGTSYSIYSKLVEIRNMFKACNEDANEFKVNGELLGNINSANWESIINKKFSRNKI